MTAVRELIFAEVARRLLFDTDAVEVERMAAGDPSAFPAINIEDVGHEADPETEPGSTRYALRIMIEGHVEGAGGADAHAAAHALYLQCLATLLPEPPLGGLAERIEEGRFQSSPAFLSDARRIGFSLEFTIDFVGVRLSPSQPPQF